MTEEKQKNMNRFKYIFYILSGLFFSSIITLYVANSFFFQPIMKNIFGRLSERTHIDMHYSSIQGNLFTGNFEIDKLRFTKRASDITDFDIEIDNVIVKAPLLNAILSKKIQLLKIEGINGQINLVRKVEKDDENIIHTLKKQKIQNKKARKKFIVENLKVDAGKLILTKQNSQPLDITINKINVLAFRNEYMVFDLLFRTNIDLSINDHTLSINKKLVDDTYETNFILSDFPVNIIADYVDKVPFNLFQKGTISIEINNKQKVQKKSVMTQWNINLSDVTAKVPDDMPFVQKVIAKQIVNYINKNNDDKNVSFKLSLDEGQFQADASSDAKNLWNIISKNLLEQLILKRKE